MLNSKKKTYINWNVQLHQTTDVYMSDIVEIDEINWKFQIYINRENKEFEVRIVKIDEINSNRSHNNSSHKKFNSCKNSINRSPNSMMS